MPDNLEIFEKLTPASAKPRPSGSPRKGRRSSSRRVEEGERTVKEIEQADGNGSGARVPARVWQEGKGRGL